MARPFKQGLDYFSLDTDFYDNLKVRKILRGCGPGAGSILICLLCNIYRNKGYYIEWNEDLPFDIADKVGVSEGSVSEVVTKAVQVDFFSRYQFEANGILTSEEILNRYKAGTTKRHDVKIDSGFAVYSGNNGVNGGNNRINGTGSTQSKVKESKVKESSRANALVLQQQDEVRQQQLKREYDKLMETLVGKSRAECWNAIKAFLLAEHRPEFIEPYVVAWNLFASNYKLAQAQAINESRKKKFKTRIREESFDFLKVLEKIKTSAHLKGDNQRGWKVDFDWILENDSNYLKIIEGNYN